uniref:WxxW domain-containing protein n=1 Tax=Echeneis naucrates TaxID=173247 RepID=A0A665UZY9_ECHNA
PDMKINVLTDLLLLFSSSSRAALIGHCVGNSLLPPACKTAWFDEGDVSRDGDSELLADLRRKHGTRICSDPVDMEAETVSGIKTHRTNATEGLLCLNSEQTWRQCEDYKVMFTCAGQFCSDCRTRWFDHDDPTENGDFEVLSDLLSVYPKEICPRPIAIEVQTISGEPASNTSDVFLNYDATYGFACVNADQDSRRCEDYRVRFTCPKEFCQGVLFFNTLTTHTLEAHIHLS